MAKDRCDICGSSLDAEGKCKSCDGLLSLELDAELDESPDDKGAMADLPDEDGDAEVDLDATVREVSDEIALIMDAFKMDNHPSKGSAPPPPEPEIVEPDLDETESAQVSQEGFDDAPLDIPEPPAEEARSSGLEGEFERAAEESQTKPQEEDLGAVSEYADASVGDGRDIADVEPLPDEGDVKVAEPEAKETPPAPDDAVPPAKTDAAAEPEAVMENSIAEATVAEFPATPEKAVQDAGKKNSGMGAAVAVILGILLVPVGFLILAFTNFTLGAIVAVVGLLIIGVGVALYFLGRRKK